MMGVGNEQWGQQYIDRYAAFARVLKEKHPEIMLVSDSGPSPGDERFHFLWPKLRELKADIVDEHCYDLPKWFLSNDHRYDNYDRSGPKVFMGEYAAQSGAVVSPKNRNNLECALAEAAYMTGLERNADVVRMASYAPLFAHADAWQWTPDLIWVDNLRVYGTPDYYVQQLFSRNRGDRVLPLEWSGTEAPGGAARRLYASAAFDNQTHEIILKVVNPGDAPTETEIVLAGVAGIDSKGRSVVLAGGSLADVNSFEEPRKVAPVETQIGVAGPRFQRSFVPRSLTVLRLRETAAP
jgi:alpha-L-arabinofuranosidase